MDIRAIRGGDIERLGDIDATVESAAYLHLERHGEGLNTGWSLQERPLRAKLINANDFDDEVRFAYRQIIGGIGEGIAMVVERDGLLVGSAVAAGGPDTDVLELLDVRVDYEIRREGLGSALTYAIIQDARNKNVRAVRARSQTNNLAAGRFLLKTGFELAGLDPMYRSNHDLVKEAVTLFWYATLR